MKLMLYKVRSIYVSWQRIYHWAGFPYLSLLAWVIPLLLFNSGQNSLMAHDEGLYAGRSRLMLESGDWIHPWATPHHKTPGSYWLIASFYQLFGMSEWSGRLPSMLTGTLGILLVYEIGRILLGKKLAWLAAAILSLEYLWLQYSRLGTPDVPTVFLILLAIWSFLQAELNPKYSSVFYFLAGLSFGLGFLVRSFMIVLPAIALLPYLIWQHRRHRHLTQPMLYLGLAVGLIPTLIWVWLCSQHYGNNSFIELVGFVLNLGSGERDNNGWEFYFWNVPLKSFPWFFFCLVGLIVVTRYPIARYQQILVGFPLVLFLELSLFPTRVSHYSLPLYPFVALLAAVGLNWLSKIYDSWADNNQNSSHNFLRNLPRLFSYTFGFLGFLLLLTSLLALVFGDTEVKKYATIALILGVSWLFLPVIWSSRYLFKQKFFSSEYWVAGWLISGWLTLAVVGSHGFLSNYNPDVKTFVQMPAISQVLNSSPIHSVQVGGKVSVLLNFYTPYRGERVKQISDLPPSSYAWVSVKRVPEISQPHRVLGSVQNVKLIQLLN